MFFLVIDIIAHGFNRRGADGECGVAFLPGEVRLLEGFFGPVCCVFFQIPHEVREAVRGFEAEKEVDVVRHASDAKRCAAEAVNHAPEVFVESRPPCGGDERLPVLR